MVHDGRETCPRRAHDGVDRCPIHLSPQERRRNDVSQEDLRETVRADVEADDDRRRTYVDAHFETLDLGSLLLDGGHVDAIVFEAVTVDGTLDLSGSVVRHPLTVRESRIGQLDLDDATFEGAVTVDGSTVGGDVATALRGRRAGFKGGFRLADGRVEGAVELSACRVEGWLTVDGGTVSGRVHIPGASLDTFQVVDATVASDLDLAEVEATHVAFDDVAFERPVDLADATIDTLRVGPAGDAAFAFPGADVAAGRLDQPDDGAALYDLTDATVGDVAIDCEAGTFDRYRFYRTRFEGFPFAAYRQFLRANGWRLHEYAGTPTEPVDTEGLELTYVEARRGARAVGDGENASAFFVRELRYSRRRYAAHASDGTHTRLHRADAALRWLTNGFLDGIAGYGERPQRIVAIAAAAIAGSALVYPAAGGLATGADVVTYGSDGLAALVDGLYFSVVTFATLGLGDVHPAGDVGRLLAASEALFGAFLTALFVFSLGRRVTR